MQTITTIGLDIAKSVFQVHGVDAEGNARSSLVDGIFRGENPADLSVQAPTKYELVINLKAPKALGLAALVAIADEVTD
jgi:putative ABC transport system substrate-binding protein